MHSKHLLTKHFGLLLSSSSYSSWSNIHSASSSWPRLKLLKVLISPARCLCPFNCSSSHVPVSQSAAWGSSLPAAEQTSIMSFILPVTSFSIFRASPTPVHVYVFSIGSIGLVPKKSLFVAPLIRVTPEKSRYLWQVHRVLRKVGCHEEVLQRGLELDDDLPFKGGDAVCLEVFVIACFCLCFRRADRAR